MSAFSAFAVSRIFCAGTITPRSITSKLLQRKHHADDVLADVVHVALDRRHDDLAIVGAGVAGAHFFRLDVGHQIARPPSSSRAPI